MASSSKEQELAIKIAGKVENSFKQSLGVTEDGLNKIASVAKKAAAVAAAAFAAVKVGDFISGAVDGPLLSAYGKPRSGGGVWRRQPLHGEGKAGLHALSGTDLSGRPGGKVLPHMPY